MPVQNYRFFLATVFFAGRALFDGVPFFPRPRGMDAFVPAFAGACCCAAAGTGVLPSVLAGFFAFPFGAGGFAATVGAVAIAGVGVAAPFFLRPRAFGSTGTAAGTGAAAAL